MCTSKVCLNFEVSYTVGHILCDSIKEHLYEFSIFKLFTISHTPLLSENPTGFIRFSVHFEAHSNPLRAPIKMSVCPRGLYVPQF